MRYKYRAPKTWYKYVNFILRIFLKKSDSDISKLPKKINHLAIVYPHMLGDSVMLLPLLNIIRRNYPETHITLFCNAHSKELFNSTRLVDDVVQVANRNVAGIRSYLANYFDIRRTIANSRHFDVLLEPFCDFTASWIASQIPATMFFGLDFLGQDYIYTNVIRHDPTIAHVVDDMVHFCKAMNLNVNDIDIYPSLIDSIDSRYASLYRNSICHNDEILVGIHPGASQQRRVWPYFERLVLDLHREFSENVVFAVFSHGQYDTFAHTLFNNLKQKIKNINLVQEDLLSYISIISTLDHLVCNDSSASHFAGALNVPQTVIYSSGPPEYIGAKSLAVVNIISVNLECKPCYDQICKYGTNECMLRLDYDEAFNLVKNSISGKVKNSS